MFLLGFVHIALHVATIFAITTLLTYVRTRTCVLKQ
jgi:hypothetical protein